MKRTEIKRYTPLRSGAKLRSRSVLARSAPKKRTYRGTGPPPIVAALVFDRDGGACVRCGTAQGLRSSHHRRPRRAGGDRRPETNKPSNLITLCGTGTTGCHSWVESNRTAALAAGWLLHANDVPSAVPLLTWWGPVYLDDKGYWRKPEQCPGCVCDPVLCENAVPDGDHCAEQSCGSCLHGCPVEGGCGPCVARWTEVPS